MLEYLSACTAFGRHVELQSFVSSIQARCLSSTQAVNYPSLCPGHCVRAQRPIYNSFYFIRYLLSLLVTVPHRCFSHPHILNIARSSCRCTLISVSADKWPAAPGPRHLDATEGEPECTPEVQPQVAPTVARAAGPPAKHECEGIQPAPHQEISRILLRPRKLISSVTSGYEQHNLATSLYWARYAL